MRFIQKRISILSFLVLAVSFICTGNGNHFVAVTDEVEEASLYDRKEYHDLNQEGTDFTYDANGNMTTDKDRGITSVKYNLLNLPDEILFSPHGDEISNMYLADGRKLFTTATTRTPVVSPSLGLDAPIPRANAAPRRDTIWMESSESTFYLGNLVCTQDNDIAPALREIAYKLLTPEGYVDYKGDYYYYRRDHLGNVREVWKPSGDSTVTVQRTRYYPSGLPWEYQAGDSASLQPYKFNGCEFIETHGYDVTDLGNRGVYHAINRFTSMDRFAEKYPWQSPYVHAGNNPVNFVDVAGDSIWFYIYDDKGIAQQVEFADLNINVQKALVMFAQTTVGYDFLSQFANAVDSFGSKEAGGVISFSKTGENVIHNYNVMQYSVEGSSLGNAGSRPITNRGFMDFDVQINTKRPKNAIEAYTTTIAHESFVHLEQHIDTYASFFRGGKIEDAKKYRRNVEYKDYYQGRTDHENYSQGKGVGYQLMMKLGQQNPNLVPFIRANINQYKLK